MASDSPQAGFIPPELLEHDGFVRNLARSLIFDETRVDDVVQETWLAVLKNPPTELGSPRAWLSRVVRNFVYKAARDDDRRLRREEVAARAEAVPSVDEVNEREALRRRIIAAADSLEEPMRATILLRYMEGLPPREVARRLGVPVETIRSRVRVIRERLRAELDGEYGDRRAWCLALLPLAALPEAAVLDPSSACDSTDPSSACDSTGPASTDPAATAGAPVDATIGGAAIGGAIRLADWIATSTVGKLIPLTLVAVATVSMLLLLHDLQENHLDAPDPATMRERSRDDAGNGFAAVGATTLERVGNPNAAGNSADTGALIIRTISARDGSPLAGIRVDVAPADIAIPILGLRPARSDDAGEIRIDDIAAGPWSVMRFDRDWTAEGITVTPGTITEYELHVDEQPFVIAGSVTHADGTPIEGAEVWLCSDTISGHNARREVVVGHDGRFELTGVLPGMYIGARADGRAPSLFRRIDADTLEVRLEPGSPGGNATLLVHDPAGNPIADAVVLVHAADPNHEPATFEASPPFALRTDVAGRTTASGLAPSLVPISIRALGHGSWNGLLDVRPGEHTTTRVTLRPGVRIHGRVVGPDGLPVDGADIEIVEAADGAYHGGRSLADGSFRVDGIGAGDIFATGRATIDGVVHTVIEEMQVEPGDVIEWQPVLDAIPPIRGRVVSAAGDPVPDCRLTLTNSTFAPDRESTMSAADGSFTFELPTAPSYELAAVLDSTDGAARFARIDDLRSGDVDVVVTLPAIDDAGSLAGRLTTAAPPTIRSDTASTSSPMASAASPPRYPARTATSASNASRQEPTRSSFASSTNAGATANRAWSADRSGSRRATNTTSERWSRLVREPCSFACSRRRPGRTSICYGCARSPHRGTARRRSSSTSRITWPPPAPCCRARTSSSRAGRRSCVKFIRSRSMPADSPSSMSRRRPAPASTFACAATRRPPLPTSSSSP